MESINSYICTHEKMINQMPGFVGIHDLESKIAFVNDKAAKIMGFKSANIVIGTHYGDMNCPASEDAEKFKTQDNTVFSKRKKLTFLSYHQYADNWKLILGEKSPLLNNKGVLLGLISYWMDITHYNLVDISRFMLQSSKKYIKVNDKFTYIIQDCDSNQYQLSERQLECLFFLIRGKSDKEISNILRLSPRTVESYINEIKHKMNCINRRQLIEKSFNEGLLNFFPKSFL